MATFNFDIGQVAITDYLIVQAKEASDPTTVVATEVYAAPHPTVRNVIFTDLNNVAHIFDFRESSDGVSLGLLLGSFNVLKPIPEIKDEIVFFKVGDGVTGDSVKGTSPNDGDDTYVNPYFDGKTIVNVFQESLRFLVMNDSTIPNEVQTVPGGGIQLLNGKKFSNDEIWSVHVTYKLNDDEIATASAPFSDIVPCIGDVLLDPSYYNKSLLISSTTATQVTTLPLLSSVPNGKGFLIKHDGGNATPINVDIAAQSGEIIRFQGNDDSNVYLGRGESVKVIKKDGKWYALDEKGQWDRVGLWEAGDYQHNNTLMGAGTTEYDGNVYKRAWKFIKSRLNPSQIKNYTDWDYSVNIKRGSYPAEEVFPNRGFYAINEAGGVKKFKIPVMLDMHIRFILNIGGADPDLVPQNGGGTKINLPGAYEHYGSYRHDHTPDDDSTSTGYGLIGVPVGSNKTVAGTDTTSGEPNVRNTPVRMAYVGETETNGRNIKK